LLDPNTPTTMGTSAVTDGESEPEVMRALKTTQLAEDALRPISYLAQSISKDTVWHTQKARIS